MLPFFIELKPGSAVSEQIVYAVKKAIILRQLPAGTKFPSVRTLSQELRINPNTAHKVIAALVGEGFLVVQPGVGTIVATQNRTATPQQRTDFLGGDLERFIIEAKGLNLDLADVQAAMEKQWNRLSKGGRKS